MSEIPQGLVKAVRERTVVPFVGAGLSMTVGKGLFPSWAGLIERFAARLAAEGLAERAAEVRAHVAGNDLVAAAEAAETQLARPFFVEEMRAAFERRRPAQADLTAVGAVWRMRPPLVITTNFDDVLRWPLELPDAVPYQAPLQPPVIVHNRDRTLLQEIHAPPDARPRVWHLHGSVALPDTIVLTTRQFERLYGSAQGGGGAEPEFEFALDRLRNLLATRPLFFVGFSLGDPYVLRHIREVLALTGHNSPVSYLFIRAGEATPHELAAYQIQRVEFDDFGGPMIERLNRIATEALPGPALPPDDPVPAALQDVVSELHAALAGMLPEPAMVAEAYNQSRPESWTPFPGHGDGVLLLRSAIARLARAPVQRASGGGWPLIAFADRLRTAAPAHEAGLQAWIDDAIDTVGSSPEERGRLRRALQALDGDALLATPPYVLVRILDTDPDRWSVQAWLFERPDAVPAALFGDERAYEPAHCFELVRDLVIALVARRIDSAHPLIAFLLPRTLLLEQVDGWRPDPESDFEPALGSSFAVTVRPLERNVFAQQYVRRIWEDLCGAAGQALQLVDLGDLAEGPGRRAVWLRRDDPAARGTMRRLRQAGVSCAILAASPPRQPGDAASALFDLVLSAGIPVVLWLRDEESADVAAVRAELAKLVGDAPVLDLPRRLRELRAEEEDAGVAGLGSRLGLLWDAADYPPPDQDPDNRATV